MMLQKLGRFITQMLSEAHCMLGASLAAEETEINKTDSPLWALWLPASHIIPWEHSPAVIPFATRLQNETDVHQPDLGLWP